jgi:multiple sugar transport system substrate-binding protein
MSAHRRLFVASVVLGALTLSACNPAAGTIPAKSASSSTDAAASFTKQLTGTFKSSGYNPSDEVGKARADWATQQVSPATITMDTTNFDTQKFAAQVASGDVPDLIQVDRSTVNTLADRKLIMPLDQCFQLYEVDPSQRYYSAAIRDVTYAGKVYGVPQFFQASIIIGNKNVLTPAGMTIDQLDTSKPDQVVEVAKQLTKIDSGKPTVLGFDADIPGSAALWFAVFGGKLSEPNGKPTLDDAKNVEALAWMKSLMDAQGGYANVKSFKDTMDVFGNNNQYVKNQVGAQTWGQWYVNVLANTKDHVSIAGSVIKTVDGQPLGYAGGTALAIPTAAKNPSAACAWAINVTSPEAWDKSAAARLATSQSKGTLFTGLFTGSPVADQAIRDKYVKSTGNADFDQVIATTYDALGHTFSFGGSAAGQQMHDALSNAVQAAMTGEQEPAAALKAAQDIAMRAWNQSAAAKNG